MHYEATTLKLITIFIFCANLFQALTQWQTQQGLLPSTRTG